MTDRCVSYDTDKINDESDIIARIEKAYDVYKISEMYLNDVRDDYGKLKIARLRMDFASHELACLLSEAHKMGIKLENKELAMKFYNSK